MESSWSMQNCLMAGIFIISISTLLYTIISNYAIRGNELKHMIDTMHSFEKKVCGMIKDVKDRVERLEDIFIKGGKK